MRHHASPARSRSDRAIWLGLLGLIGLAAVNQVAARIAEQAHPPGGRFLDIDGVRLHYTDRGQGSPILLIHGNTVTGDDWRVSGVAERLERDHRVIVIDRPGFGHSTRPRGRVWTANAQADLFARALRQLGVERALVVGHSWGTLAALAMAIRWPEQTSALVLISGYYFWTIRADVLLVAPGAVPGLGDVIAHTVAPLMGYLQLPLLRWAVFSPARVPERFDANYSPAMAFRPSQVRVTAVEGTFMIPDALRNARHYAELEMPVSIITGDGDRIVFPRNSRRLHAAIPGSTLTIVPGAGHMVHHVAPQTVVQAVKSLSL